MTPETAHPQLLAFLRARLRAAAMPERAPGMASYMKSAMPFLGVPAPVVARCVRDALAAHPLRDTAQLQATAQRLWDVAAYREERYAALRLTQARLARGEPSLLPFYTTVIAQGQWWDYVDSVTPRLWEVLNEHPALLEPVLRAWATDPNRWFRRAAILAQLPAKDATDQRLLADVLVANLADPDFFVRKAIGWALRQYARTDPDWVRVFLHTHAGELSALSRREALKHLGASG